MKALKAAVAAAAVLVCAPATAQAAISVTVTGDDGQPAALNTSDPLPIRNMDVRVNARVDTSEGGRWSLAVLDPAGNSAAIGFTCFRTQTFPEDTSTVTHRGNGTYTVVLSFYEERDTGCSRRQRELRYAFTVGASVAIGQPAGPALTRAPGSLTTNVQTLDFAGNPGAWSYEVRYARGAVLGPDGGIAGPSELGFVNSQTGRIELIGLRQPGTYTVVARAKAGDVTTAWSAPVTLTLMAPFDLQLMTFPDSRGPRYQVRAQVREPSAAGGRVTVALAKGRRGGRFRTLGRARINSQGVFKLRFTIRRRGAYRLRFSYRGSATVTRGTQTAQIRIRRIILG